MSHKVDPILVSVIQRRLKAITEEMGLVLLRTARSPILSEARDFVTGLYDAEGKMLEQTEYIPVLAFAIQPSIEYMVNYFKDNIYPGDVIIHNDPFTGGNQPADVKIVRPIFYKDKLVAWAAINGHQADVGGAVAGAYNPAATEIWQEALRITPVKLYEKGQRRKDVWDLVFGNIRFPQVQEDIQAAIGGTAVGERQLLKLIERYGWETFDSHVRHLYDSTEQMMRAEIAAIPDGVYKGKATAYYDGVTLGTKMDIHVTITVEGDEITFDFEGTAPQTPGYVNAPFSSSASSTILTFLMCINKPDIPHNAGLLRPLHIRIPEGSMLNPRFPAASTFGNHLSDQISAAIFSALGEAIPDRVTAAWNPTHAAVVVGFNDKTNQPYVDILFNGLKGGGGGTAGADGYDHIGLIACGGGLLAQDPEMFEVKEPHFVHKFEFKQDSAGSGQWRGGMGVELEFEFLTDNVMISAFGDGMDEESAARGLGGGKAGMPNYSAIRYPDGRVHETLSKEVVTGIPKGSRWYQIAGGGGGFGDPLLRPVERVAEEVRYGYVSIEKAARDYGVVVDPVTFEVNQAETERLRKGAVAAD